MLQQVAQWNKTRDVWETGEMDLFSEHSGVFSETFPKSGMTRNGRLFLRPALAHHTKGNESSSSPGLPTPRSSDAAGGVPDRKERGYGDQLNDIPWLLPTTRVSMSGGASRAELKAGNPFSRLETAVELLPRLNAHDGARRGSQHPAKRRAGGPQPSVADHVEHTDMGKYAPAVDRWANVSGRNPPSPTELSATGKPRLSPRFAEWMMGLPDGWVTSPDIGLSRAQQLKALGNGVVPQQAAFAVSVLLARSEIKF